MSMPLGLPPYGRGYVQEFIGSALSGATWQTWNKPPNVTMVSILAIGAGHGGGGGFTGVAGAARGGGGGGGSAAMIRTTIPASHIPDVLFVIVYGGGPGGAAGSPGNLEALERLIKEKHE